MREFPIAVESDGNMAVISCCCCFLAGVARLEWRSLMMNPLCLEENFNVKTVYF